ncbi:MAG: hypothetical protein AAB685_02080 [Patescibacteria group bacterium]
MSFLEDFTRKFDFDIKLIIIGILTVVVVNLVLINKKISSQISSKVGTVFVKSQAVSDTCGEKCIEEIKRAITSLSTPAPVLKSNYLTPSSIKKQVSYIPLGGSFSTTKTDWTDIKTTDVTVDFANDYGADAKISWEGTLKVANANGIAYARILDTTHGTAVDGSEISLTNNSASTLVSSGLINPWSGRNTYRVQVKSLNSSEVFFDNGRIKVSY